MEKSTEPNESKQEEGINEASEISTSQEEQSSKRQNLRLYQKSNQLKHNLILTP